MTSRLSFSEKVTSLFKSLSSILCLSWYSGKAYKLWASQGELLVKNLPANAGDARDMGSIPGSGRSLGGGHGNPLQYSCLENPVNTGA